MTILVIGGTGTLGRQVVRQALTEGYQVRCLVRNIRKANFLKEWGAELVYGDFTIPETLPLALRGISIVIDAATSRPEDDSASLTQVDYVGKLALIRASQVAQIKQYVFFSIIQNQNFSIPLMKFKKQIENTLRESTLTYTIYQLSGFYQGLIAQYAVPILDQETIWLTDDATSINYLNSQDIAKFCLRGLQIEESQNKTFALTGKKTWLSSDIIKLCETLSGQTAQIRYVPILSLKILRSLFGFSKWGWPIHDRLAFSEILSTVSKFGLETSLVNICKLFQIHFEDILSLEDYFQEYFETMLDKLRNLNYDQTQATKRKDLTF
uniref:Photosystem I assembly protein Ycf39 n=1 Tax=Rhizochromulina marina TaxID=1034831 RepID=A0A514CQ13_9STRA|nr:photosystem I assembly protein Ycf39 [Rhizochromulina marina]QDH81885.1 photosystem I assembly protein Ycf39 [Rhizochromulina marina]